MSKSPVSHSLKPESFMKALERYVDENKPDQLMLKQIQGWEMQWSSSVVDDAKKEDSVSPGLDFEPTDVLEGVLTWTSDYMVAEIECSCHWEPHHDLPAKPFGTIHFLLRAKLKFRTKHNDRTTSKEEIKAQEKIRTKMIQRLGQDPYIKRLLHDNNPAAAILCEARISAKDTSSVDGKLEERVDVTDNVAEGLRRALFSQAESSLDVVEMLLSLPLLPGSIHEIGIHCPLADRAKLRLLEDAMFDACEREGENELIDDLKITAPSGADSDGGNPEGGMQNPNKTGSDSDKASANKGGNKKHQKAQQPTKSNKRTRR